MDIKKEMVSSPADELRKLSKTSYKTILSIRNADNSRSVGLIRFYPEKHDRHPQTFKCSCCKAEKITSGWAIFCLVAGEGILNRLDGRTYKVESHSILCENCMKGNNLEDRFSRDGILFYIDTDKPFILNVEKGD